MAKLPSLLRKKNRRGDRWFESFLVQQGVCKPPVPLGRGDPPECRRAGAAVPAAPCCHPRTGIDDFREALVEHFGLSPADDELVGITAAMASRSADEEVPRSCVYWSRRIRSFHCLRG